MFAFSNVTYRFAVAFAELAETDFKAIAAVCRAGISENSTLRQLLIAVDGLNLNTLLLVLIDDAKPFKFVL